ncbi:AAA family ATPase, CDC48 subfamily (fragment) [groundwater metagenome]|uniref:AAA family ATPase, CDC48 subfamily n=1 Tax=groundwater metagenome TaxID=717931 RepID=A0A098ECW2_9ZZZZ
MDEKANISLIVEEAMTGDVGRGKIRIDDITMKFLNITSGDAIMITGKYPSVAIALPLHYEDYGKQIIRMDGWVRRNTGVSIGKKVALSKADIKDAEHIIIAPVKSNEFFSRNATNLIKQYLQNMEIPLGEGDLLPISIGLGVWKNFVIVRIIPQGFVMCSDYTTVEITYDSKAYC